MKTSIKLAGMLAVASMILCSCDQPQPAATSSEKATTVPTTKPAAATTKPVAKKTEQNIQPDQPTTAPVKAAKTNEPQAETKPLAAPKLVATVAGKKIMSDKMDKVLAKAPPQVTKAQIDEFKVEFTANMIMEEIFDQYIDAAKVVCDDADLAKIKAEVDAAAAKNGMSTADFMEKQELTEADLKNIARKNKLITDITSDEKANELIKAHPEYFNGTKLKASHILIPCNMIDSTASIKGAYDKINKLAADIKAGKISFEDAAKANSICPSKEKGGDLGEFAFTQMVPQFAITAFATKENEISPVVRTKFGLHLIKVTGRTEGNDPQSQQALGIAKGVLNSQLLGKILDTELTTCPVVITEEFAPKPPVEPEDQK